MIPTVWSTAAALFASRKAGPVTKRIFLTQLASGLRKACRQIKIAKIPDPIDAIPVITKPVYELEDQAIDHSCVSDVVTWFIPFPTWLPIEDGETFTFPLNGDPTTGGQRIVIRFFSACFRSQDLSSASELMAYAAKSFNLLPAGKTHDALLSDQARNNWQTVAEVSAFVDFGDSTEHQKVEIIRESLDLALDYARQIQHAIYVLDKVPRPLVTTQSLPPYIPYSIYSVSRESLDLPLGFYLIPSVIQSQAHWHFSEATPSARGTELIDRESLHAALDRQLLNGPFSDYSRLMNETQVAMLNAGLPRASLLAAATAGEVLLDETLRCVLWESGTTPEEAGELFARKRDFKPRTTNLMPRYLGGSWNVRDNGIVSRWFEEVYRFRHRIVHAGAHPEYEDVVRAFTTTQELGEFVADRLVSNANQFPRSAMFFLGRPGLQERGLWDERFQNLSTSPDEPDWMSTFSRWRKSVEIVRELESATKSLEGNIEDSILIYWAHPSGDFRWVIFDQEAYATTEVDPEQITEMDEAIKREVHALTVRAQNRKIVSPVERVIVEWSVSADATFEWKLPYQNLPMENVLVDGRELRFGVQP